MDGSDTSPLLASDSSPERDEEEEKENFDLRNVVLFHGKVCDNVYVCVPCVCVCAVCVCACRSLDSRFDCTGTGLYYRPD